MNVNFLTRRESWNVHLLTSFNNININQFYLNTFKHNTAISNNDE